MTKIDIFSGFLGAGKTTLIKKLLKEAYKDEKVVLIENEFGEIGIDGGFLKDAGVEITEMNQGCICCSLVGDFAEALKKVLDDFTPDRILIEPSGVGKLSDVIKAVKGICNEDVLLNAFVTVADAEKCKMYMKNFGEFYNDQVENAGCIILSHTQSVSDEKLSKCIELLREHNKDAVIVTTPWDKLTGEQIIAAMEQKTSLLNAIKELEEEELCPECGCHHEHHHHDHCDCEEHHHEHHHEHCDCEEHHHEHHHDHCGCEEHHHEHHHDHCGCEEHHHEHHHEHCGCEEHHHGHHHHHAEEVFTSWGKETTDKYTKQKLKDILSAFEDEQRFGFILRAKGIVQGEGDLWLHFDYVPGKADIREGKADVIGRLCVIGSKINEEEIKNIF